MADPTIDKYINLRCDDSKTEAQITGSPASYTNKIMIPSDKKGIIYFVDEEDTIIKLVKSDLTAATAPSVTDDEDDGFQSGSFRLDTSTGYLYYCTDPTAGAAVWERLAQVAELPDFYELSATTSLAGAGTDSADLTLDGGSYLTVDDESIAAYEFVITAGSTVAGARGQWSWHGQAIFSRLVSDSIAATDGFIYNDVDTAAAAFTIATPAASVALATGNIVFSVEHTSSLGAATEITWNCTLRKVSTTGVQIAS